MNTERNPRSAWYSKSIRRTLEEMESDAATGLDRKEVRKRRRRYGSNDIFSIPKQPYRSYLAHLLTDIPTILLVLTLLVAIFFEHQGTLAVCLVLVGLHILFALMSYARARRVMDTISRHALPTAKVLREGKLYLIKQKDLVPGDIIYLSPGDIVPCDARLVESEDLAVLETALTGLTHATAKSAEFIGYGDLPPAKLANMVFASTVVTVGRGKAIVCEVGSSTLVCRMDKNKPMVTHEALGILTALQKISGVWSVCMMVLLFLLTALKLVIGGGSDILTPFLTALSLAVAAMSEYYMPFAFLIVACGVYTAVRARKGSASVMIKNVGSLGALRSVTTLILPLEGVFVLADHEVDGVFSGNAYHGKDEDLCAFPDAMETVRTALLSTGLYGAAALEKNNRAGENIYSPEEEAIIALADRMGLYNHALEEQFPLSEHRPADVHCPLETSITFGSGFNRTALRGDIDIMLSCCTHYRLNGRVMRLDDMTRNDLASRAHAFMKRAYRVIAVGSGVTDYEKVSRPLHIQRDLIFEGFLAIRRPLVDGAVQQIKRLRENGIQIMLLSGNDPAAVGIAKALGIIKSEEEVLTGGQIAAMKEGIFRLSIKQTRLYIGLSASQKQTLLRALKDEDETVAVLADSIPDIALYRIADVSIAGSLTLPEGKHMLDPRATARSVSVFAKEEQGMLGCCDALKFTADVVIARAQKDGNGGFHAALRAITSAKAIYSALHRAIRFLLMTQSARLLLTVLSILSPQPLLSPTAILYLGLFTDFLGIVLIAFSADAQSLAKFPLPVVKDETKPLSLLLPHLSAALLGLVWGGVIYALPKLLSLLGSDMGIAGTKTFTFFALAFFGLVAPLFAALTPVLSRPFRLRRIAALIILLQIALPLLSLFFPDMRTVLDPFALTKIGAITLGISMITLSAISLFVRYLVRKRLKSSHHP